MYYCIECGKANPERARFCAFCGAKLFTGSLETDADEPRTEAAEETEKPVAEKPFSIADIFAAPAVPVSGAEEASADGEPAAAEENSAGQEEPASAENDAAAEEPVAAEESAAVPEKPVSAENDAAAEEPAAAETPAVPEKPAAAEKPVQPAPARETVQPKAENPAQPKPEWAKKPAQPVLSAQPAPQPVQEAVKVPAPQPEPEEKPAPVVRMPAPAAQEKALYDDDFDLDAPEEPERSVSGRLSGFLQKMRLLRVEDDLWEEAEQETEEDDFDPYGDDDEDGDDDAFDTDDGFDDDEDEPEQEQHGMSRALGRLLKKEPETVVTSSGMQELPPRRPLGREGRDTHVPKRILTPAQKEQKLFLSEDEPDGGDIYDDDEDERYVQRSVAKILFCLVLVLALSIGLWVGCTASGQVFLAGFGLSKSADAYRTLGDRARAANQIKRAAEAYYTALSLDPNDYETALWVGITRQQIGDYETAANAYYKCTTLDPARSDAYVYLVKLYQAQGDSTAEAYWREQGKKNTGLESLGV